VKMKAIDSRTMKQIEERASQLGVSRLLMMENAGKAVAQAVLRFFDEHLKPKVLVVAGTGNNGGDGAAAARHLAGRADVSVLLLGGTEKVKAEEASLQWRILKEVEGIRFVEAKDEASLNASKSLFAEADVIVDAIFGTGIKGHPGGLHGMAMKMINESSAMKVAVDIPSGLDPDTGQDNGLVVKADVTVTLHAAKEGLLKREDVVGLLLVEGIGVPNFSFQRNR